MTVVYAATLALTSISNAQRERPQSASSPEIRATTRVILPGDVLKISFETSNGPAFAPVQAEVTGEGFLSMHGSQLWDAIARQNLRGLTTKQAADRIAQVFSGDSSGENPIVTVTFVGEHVAKAEGSVRLIADPRLATLDLSTAISLSQASGIVKSAVAAAGLNPNRCSLTITPTVDEPRTSAEPRGSTMSIVIRTEVMGGSDDQARAILQTAAEQVAEIFREWGEQEKVPMLAKLKQAEDMALSLDTELNILMSNRSALLGDYSSVTEYLKAIQTLSCEVASMGVSLEGESIRKSILADKVKTIRAQMAESAKTDAMLAELEKVVALREQAMKAIQERVAKGVASETELAEAQEKLALAKVEALRRREEVSRSAGGDQLAQLAQQLTAAELAEAETTRRRDAMLKRLDQMKANDSVKKVQSYQARIDELEDFRQEYLKQVRELQRTLRGAAIVAIPAIMPDAIRKTTTTLPTK